MFSLQDTCTGRRSRRQERAEVKACKCTGPTGIARSDVLAQYDEGREAILGGTKESAAWR